VQEDRLLCINFAESVLAAAEVDPEEDHDSVFHAGNGHDQAAVTPDHHELMDELGNAMSDPSDPESMSNDLTHSQQMSTDEEAGEGATNSNANDAAAAAAATHGFDQRDMVLQTLRVRCLKTVSGCTCCLASASKGRW